MEKTARKIPRAWEKTGYSMGNVFPPQGYDVDAALGVKDEIRVLEQKLRGYTWATRQYSFLGMFLNERIWEVFGRLEAWSLQARSLHQRSFIPLCSWLRFVYCYLDGGGRDGKLEGLGEMYG